MSDQQDLTAAPGDDRPEPELRFRLSPLVLTVFRRETSDGTVIRHCDLQRVYTPDDGDTFDYTKSLRPRDLRKAAELLETAANRLDNFSVEYLNTDPQGDT